MSELPTSQVPRRLRTWILLAVSVGVLMVMSLLSLWVWVQSESDLRAVEAEVLAAGFTLGPDQSSPTDSLRLARARSAEAAARAINIDWQGRSHNLKSSKPIPDEYRAIHQAISSQEVCDVAREIIALGNAPIRPPGEQNQTMYTLRELFFSRVVIAEGEEFDLCLTALQVHFEMLLRGGDEFSGGLSYFFALCSHLARRVSDKREQLRPLADWLESTAQRCWDAQPQLAERNLQRSLTTFRDGEQVFKDLGIPVVDLLQYPMVIPLAMRAERASVLREKLSWLQFIKGHPGQPRLWLNEAERRFLAQSNANSWLGETGQWLLFHQHPELLRRWTSGVLYARLIAAELRGSPWPIDLYDSAGSQLRRWEKNGHLIGAYSVGPDGRDDGGTTSRDILLRLHLDPPEPTTTP